MRKNLTDRLSTCVLLSSLLLTPVALVGCGEESAEKQTGEKLEALLVDMSNLSSPYAPLQGNTQEYSTGIVVDGVSIPGRYRDDAAYIDQSLALLPKAQEIAEQGNASQQKSANTIIASILADEGAYLINAAELVFQEKAIGVPAKFDDTQDPLLASLENAYGVADLRDRVEMLVDITSRSKSLSADPAAKISTLQTGKLGNGTTVDGIDQLNAKSQSAATAATAAQDQLDQLNKQIASLEEEAAEYEVLELQLDNKARAAQDASKYDVLDKATDAAFEGETAEAKAVSLGIDVAIQSGSAEVAQSKRLSLSGTRANEADTSLVAAFERMLGEAAVDASVQPTDPIYREFQATLDDAKKLSASDEMKAAAFMLALSGYEDPGTPGAADRSRLTQAIQMRISPYVGAIGMLELKVGQLMLEQSKIADKVAELETARKAQVTELTALFNELDAQVQAGAFARMAKATEKLDAAAEAMVKANLGPSSKPGEMGIYTLHARSLQQRAVASRSYAAVLESLAAAGPEVIGSGLHTALLARIKQMQETDASVNAAAAELELDAASTLDIIAGQAPAEGDTGPSHVELFQSLVGQAKAQ